MSIDYVYMYRYIYIYIKLTFCTFNFFRQADALKASISGRKGFTNTTWFNFFKWKEAECNTNLKQFKYILMLIIADSSKGISETWVVRQRLEDLYKKLLLMDLEYALDKKVEQDLYV